MLAMCGVLVTANPLFGQTISITGDGLFAPGRYVPLRINIDAPGEIRVRGELVQGIDLSAAGRGSVVVPLMLWRTTAGEIELLINGRPQRFHVQPIEAGQIASPDLRTFWATSESDYTTGPRSAQIDATAYESLDLWRPGRSEAVRKYLRRAAVVALLVLGAALYIRKRASAIVMGVAATGMMVGAILAMPADVARLRQPVGPMPRAYAASVDRAVAGRQWIWRASNTIESIEEPFGNGLWFVPRSAEHLAQLRPVLRCDARGKPLAIRVSLSGSSNRVKSETGNDRAAFVLMP